MIKTSESQMYFFDMRNLLSTILLATKSYSFHTGMADAVDVPSEYGHPNPQESCI